jgi:hypothetical protein
MQVIAGLQHPNIVRFLDSGSDQGTFFFRTVCQARLRCLELRCYSLPPPHRQVSLALRERLEKHHGVALDDDALRVAVEWSARYLPDFRLPDKALDLVDQACAAVRFRTLTPQERKKSGGETPPERTGARRPSHGARHGASHGASHFALRVGREEIAEAVGGAMRGSD